MADSGRRLAAHWERLAALDPDQSIIDPSDRLGQKNRYIALLRDLAISEALDGVAISGLVLDYGCGSGSSTKSLLSGGRAALGMDISPTLLLQAKARCSEWSSTFLRSDGVQIPLQNSSLASIVTYGVLIYAVEEQRLKTLLKEMHRCLAPGGRLVLVEQVRRRAASAENGLKRFRTMQEWNALIEQSGFRVERSTIVRHGRLPTTLAIRRGLIPQRHWPLLMEFERLIGRTVGILPWDYADARFIATK